MAKIAEQTGATPAVVRGLVGKMDPQEKQEKRRRQEETARRIDAEEETWPQKVARWTAETGQSGATFWRVLQGR